MRQAKPSEQMHLWEEVQIEAAVDDPYDVADEGIVDFNTSFNTLIDGARNSGLYLNR